MNKAIPILLVFIGIIFISCEKEYSSENNGTGSDLIVGADCRISKIVYTDTAANAGLGSIEAVINSLDIVTRITKFDSLSNTIEFIGTPVYTNDTVYINPDEYYVVDINKRISKLHALTDPTDPFSPQFDVSYFYDAAGYLINKFYTFTSIPGLPFYIVRYTYSGGKLIHMRGNEQIAGVDGDLIVDADINYFSNIMPARFMYLFPDEQGYSHYSQFFNFGARPSNAPKNITVRYYDPGNVLRDSTVSTFSNYIMSRDNYVLSLQMGGDDLPSIPASAGKLSFSYKCR
jgi:hypothetical protein